MYNFIDILKDTILDVVPLCLIFLSIGLCLTLICLTGVEQTTKINNEYEKILNLEYGRTFESYNEFLVYKLNSEV